MPIPHKHLLAELRARKLLDDIDLTAHLIRRANVPSAWCEHLHTTLQKGDVLHIAETSVDRPPSAFPYATVRTLLYDEISEEITHIGVQLPPECNGHAFGLQKHRVPSWFRGWYIDPQDVLSVVYRPGSVIDQTIRELLQPPSLDN